MTTCTAESVSQEQFDQLLDCTMDNFDFEKVHKVMTTLDWGWTQPGREELVIPTVAQLRGKARQILREAFKRKTTVGTGGFEAIYHPPLEGDKEDPAGFLTLRFIIEEWDTEGCPIH
jgi:hypothetical protein